MEKLDNRILIEADKLFMKYGMRSVTMDDIAKHLGISKKTIYANFKDKNELVLQLVANKLKADQHTLEQCAYNANNAIEEVFLVMNFMKETLTGINPIVFIDLEKYHGDAHKLMINFHQTFVFNAVKAGLERGIKENIFRSDINTEILAAARVGQINWTLESNLIRSGMYSVYDVFQELTTQFLFGICTLSGNVMINNYQLNKTIQS